MTPKELLYFRAEMKQMIAVLQPELQVEIKRMEELQRKAEAAAKIVGTQESADAKLKEAEARLVEVEQGAAVRLAAVAEAEKLVERITADVRDSQERAGEHIKSLQEAKAAHDAKVKEQVLAHNVQLQEHARRSGELDIRAEKLSALEERLRVKEHDMAVQLRKVKEALA